MSALIRVSGDPRYHSVDKRDTSSGSLATSIPRPSLRSGAGWQEHRPRPYDPLQAASGGDSLRLASKVPQRTSRTGASHIPTLGAHRPKLLSHRGSLRPYPILVG